MWRKKVVAAAALWLTMEKELRNCCRLLFVSLHFRPLAPGTKTQSAHQNSRLFPHYSSFLTLPACIAKPMPSPYSTRAASNTERFGDTPSSVAPAPYSAAASISSVRRPILLPLMRASREPERAPSRLMLTTRPVWKAVRLYLCCVEGVVVAEDRECVGLGG